MGARAEEDFAAEDIGDCKGVMTVVNDVADKEIKKALSVLTKNIIIATSQSKQEGLKFYIQEAVRDAIPNIREAFLMKLVREEIKDLTKNLLLSELNEIKVEYANMGKALSGINANDIVAEFDLMHTKNPFRLFKNPIWFCQNYCKKRSPTIPTARTTFATLRSLPAPTTNTACTPRQAILLSSLL